MLVGVDDAVQGLLKQPCAEATLCVLLVTGKPGDERDADLVEPDPAAAVAAGQLDRVAMRWQIVLGA